MSTSFNSFSLLCLPQEGNSYRLDDDVEVCTCNAARYKTTNVRAPDHVQAFWDAQCRVAHSSYRRRLKHYALPTVHVDRLASEMHSWRILNVDAESIKEVSPDFATNALSLSGSDSTCLLYTSDAADEEDSVDLGGRR